MRLHELDFKDLYQRWAQGSGPFSCFVRKTNFVSLQQYPDFELRPVNLGESRLFKQVRSKLEAAGKNTLFVFDIPARNGMHLAYLAQNLIKMKPVLTFVNPLHPYGLVGGEAYISDLAGYGHNLQPLAPPKGYIMILDSQRYKDKVSRQTMQKRFNNQYELTADDLPSYEMLLDLHFSRVSFFHLEDVREDSEAYINYLNEQGILIEDLELNKTDLR